MINVAITGENGFLGTHLRNYFLKKKLFNYIFLGRNFEDSIYNLKNGDILIHAASVHRNLNPEMVYDINMQINKKLLNSLQINNLSLNVVFISSIQESLDNPYGRSKRDGKLLFKEYCKKNKCYFISHKLPNLFGPNAKPNYTSFIATFCYNLNNNISCVYNSKFVNLCYVNDAVKKIAEFTWDKIKFNTVKISVKNIYFLLKEFKRKDDNNEDFNSLSYFEKNLLKTYLSYKNYIII